MITRPLELASQLRPEPRNFDLLFLVNGGLIVLFFFLFGSSFVLAPGIALNFQMQEVAGARSGAAPTTHRITVKPSGLIFTDKGPVDVEQLGNWLKGEAVKTRQASLLIIASKDVLGGRITEIANVAHAAGFVNVQWAAEEPTLEKH